MSADFYTVADATTGAPSDLDQIVDFLNGNKDANTTAFLSLATPGALTATINTTSGNLSGNYQYAVAFVTGYWQGAIGAGTLYTKGNTGGGTTSTIITVTNEQIDLSNIPIGGAGVVARIIYRTKGNGSTFYFLQQISDNTTTTWLDDIPDTSLGAQMPTTNTTGSKWSFYDVTAETVTLQSTTQPIVFPNLSAFPAIAPSGTMIVVDYTPYVSNGTSWVDPMIDLMQLSTSHGGTADFYGATTLHGGVSLTVNQLPAPTGLTATNATSGTVGSYIAASTQYTYSITAVSYDNTETNASTSASVTTGATAYPINLAWTNGGADVQFYNVYKGGVFLAQVAGALAAYQDTGNTATTSQTPPTTNQTGIIEAGNGITGTGDTGALNAGTGILNTANAWTATQNMSITGNAATAANAAQLGGIPAADYLRTDAAAPNPQTVANPVNFSSALLISMGTISGLTRAFRISSSTNNLSIEVDAGAGNLNPLAQSGDTLFYFYSTAQNLGALTIAPWSTSKSGIRISQSAVELGANTTVDGTVTAASGQLGSASGTWTPAAGTFNVAAGTVINVASVPSGAKMFFVGYAGGGYNTTTTAYPTMWGVMTPSGVVAVYGPIGNGGKGTIQLAPLSIGGNVVDIYDGSYEGQGYFQLNGGFLQFYMYNAGTASATMATTLGWGVS